MVQQPRNCISLYNALDINDSVVSNCIVDNSSPENILLIPDDQTAIQLLSNQHNVPRNCHQGVTIKGDRYYPDPNYRTYASNYHQAKYLQVDTEEYLRYSILFDFKLSMSVKLFRKNHIYINVFLNPCRRSRD